MKLESLPKIGETLEGGIFAGLTTTKDGTHYGAILLADKPKTRLSWGDAMAFAERINAALPTRAVAAQLFANLKPQFEEARHWTSEALNEDCSYARYQHFYYGSQGYDLKAHEGRASSFA
ncbi:DUF1566 domain-containing protein [Piscinibacter aquaticus]|uniref:DUF1566 domain-containing protein n=1 Tax=Piscinibacter aquaticus TaxID=392597 RepID=A0A5C6TN47_9BURK|nr:DUF1566 domain-containing protein [Piscinibacter aquaticus]